MAFLTRCIWVLGFALALLSLGTGTAEAKKSRPILSKAINKSSGAIQRKTRATAKKNKRSSGKGRLVCTGKGSRRRCHRERGRFAGRAVAASELRTEPLPRPSGKIHILHAALKEDEELNIYKPDGSYDEATLARLDSVFRCRRTGEERAVDPRLYEILSIIYDHFGGRPIELTSGFRYQRNEGSRHFHASAMDVTVEGISYKELYDFADSLDSGGMGIGKYPHDGFVHIDFRAPGEPSYRWTDTSRSRAKAQGRRPSVMWRPNS